MLLIICECGAETYIPENLPNILVCSKCKNRFKRVEKAIYRKTVGKGKVYEGRKESPLSGFFGTGSGGGG